MKHAFTAALAALLAGGAAAHDTWFSITPAGGLQLVTGNRYPVPDVSPGARSLANAECIGLRGERFALQPVEKNARWLDLAASRAAVSCWAELKSFDIELTPELVKVYLDEIRAPANVRDAWAALQARGLPWRESYRKFARVELAGGARQPAGLPMEIVLLGDAPVRTGAPLEFQVLRDGQPLAGFAVELVSERSRLGVWRETDSEGKVRHTLPFAGQWLLRGTEVRPTGDAFVSRFVTLSFEAR